MSSSLRLKGEKGVIHVLYTAPTRISMTLILAAINVIFLGMVEIKIHS